MIPRVGLGTDLHRLEPGDGLRLGGLTIPGPVRAVAWSDGDALLHAVTDAILGALGDPDLGELFPDRDPANRGRDSADFLAEALRRMRALRHHLGNLDAVVHLEAPRVAPHKAAIRARLAELTGCAAVNVKAKTGEKIGVVGRGEAVETAAVVLLVPDV